MMTHLEQLQKRIIGCTKCCRLVPYIRDVAIKKRRMYRKCEYWGKPVPSFGDPKARVVILGLAPAAHGGNRTGRVFTGDLSGDWVYGTLYRYGFAATPNSTHRNDGQSLKDVYITAALRCAPPSNKPLREELLNCRPYLVQELQLLHNWKILLALGKIAFDTYLRFCKETGAILPSPMPKFGHGVVYKLDNGTTLVGSYHPSRQNTQTGRLTKEMFENVFNLVKMLLEKD